MNLHATTDGEAVERLAARRSSRSRARSRVRAPRLRHALSDRGRLPRGRAAPLIWRSATSRRTQSLRVAADVSATVAEVDGSCSHGNFAAGSGPRVHGMHSAREYAHHRPRICMLCLICPHRQRRCRAGHFEHLACPRAHVLVLNFHVPSQ